MKVYRNLFDAIISEENLFSAWDAFESDKRNKSDVRKFAWRLEEHIFKLHRELRDKTYQHGPYEGFYIRDPKQRHIHKASVRDRILHHAIFSVVNPVFEETFIPTSFSCRIGYGTHKGVDALERMTRKISESGRKPCFILKCDVKKFFDSIDHAILLSVIGKRIKDEDTIWLLKSVIGSYGPTGQERERESKPRKGIPIGNLTSQIFANIYMNELDQFVKHSLKVKYYLRYTDDFAIVAESREYLEHLLPRISEFLEQKLALTLHPKKVIIRPLYQGVDFLGYVVFPKHRLLRSKTKQRIFKKMRKRVEEYKRGKISKTVLEQSLQSYLGVFSHANTYELKEKFLNEFCFQGGLTGH